MKMKKMFFIGIVLILITCFFSTSVYALTLDDLNGTGAETGNIINAGEKLITIISVIGSIVSVITLICLGIKYMLGSVEEKAEYKKTLMPYVIGAFFVFCASTIAGIIYRFF